MVDPSAPRKKRKGSISEEDICNISQKYNATIVLTLLGEMAQVADVKIDWNALVKKTATGITSPREYQMLWRHLAYRIPLMDKIEGAQPLDDDSDLEYELEASPPPSAEDAMEVANCVKILASGAASDSTVEGDVLKGNPTRASSEISHQPSSCLNTTLPLPSAGISGEGIDAQKPASATYPSRRKRKPWTEEEDLQLIAAVSKYGEGNWANIVKGEYKWDRTASQLSQRWAIIKKKPGGLSIVGASSSGSQLSEVQLATRRAIDMALKDNLTAGCGAVANGAAGTSNPTNINPPNGDSPVTNITVPPQPPLSQITNATSVKPGPGPMGSAPKPRPPIKKVPPTKPSISADPIQAAAVAAGARIASPKDAESLLKAAQSKNAVHIIGGGGGGGGGSSLIKSSSAASTSTLPPNVHFIRTGLAATPSPPQQPPSMAAAVTVSKCSTVKHSLPVVSKPKIPPNTAPSTSAIVDPQQKLLDKNSTELKIPGSDVKMMGVKEEGPKLALEKGRDLSKEPSDVDMTENESKDEVRKQAAENLVVKGDNENQSAIVKMEISSEEFGGAGKSDKMDIV